jgi:thiamine biosynthesis lipoprotein
MSTGSTVTTTHVEHVMGTAVRFVADAKPGPGEIDRAVAWLHWVDRTFSIYRENSEIMRLRRGELDDPHHEVGWVLDRCLGLQIRTEGAFDHRIEDALDPSGYVKGWAIQRAADLLAAGGLERFYIDAGGDIAMRGRFVVGIRNPRTPEVPMLALDLEDTAIATSGTYERGEHIWGDHPGGLASVSVVGPDLGIADAIATALFAAGGDNAAWLERFPEYHVYSITHDLQVRAA